MKTTVPNFISVRLLIIPTVFFFFPAKSFGVDCKFRIFASDFTATLEKFDDISWLSGSMTKVLKGTDVWFRCQVVQDTLIEDAGVLQLGILSSPDITYLDSVEVGSTVAGQKSFAGMWTGSIARSYVIDNSFVRQSKHLVVVHFVAEQDGNVGFDFGFPKISNVPVSHGPMPVDYLPSLFALGFTSIWLILRTGYKNLREGYKSFLPLGLSIAALQFFNSFYLYKNFYEYSVLWIKIHILILCLSILFSLNVGEELLRRKSNFLIKLGILIIAATV